MVVLLVVVMEYVYIMYNYLQVLYKNEVIVKCIFVPTVV